MGSVPVRELPQLYVESQQRIAELVSGIGEDLLMTPVPCCPAWSVRDAVGHLTAVAEDALNGRLTGPPTEKETAAQVERYAAFDADEVLVKWDELAAALGPQLAEERSWPLYLDVLAHEHDIKGALGRPGNREDKGVLLASERLLRWLRPPARLLVSSGELELLLGPETGEPIALCTTPFDSFRWRLGRRSRRQLSALEWEGDPTVLLDSLCAFGPSQTDIIE